MAWSCSQNVRTDNELITLRTDDVPILRTVCITNKGASTPVSQKISEIVRELFHRLALFIVERRPEKMNSIIQKLETDLKRYKNK